MKISTDIKYISIVIFSARLIYSSFIDLIKKTKYKYIIKLVLNETGG